MTDFDDPTVGILSRYVLAAYAEWCLLQTDGERSWLPPDPQRISDFFFWHLLNLGFFADVDLHEEQRALVEGIINIETDVATNFDAIFGDEEYDILAEELHRTPTLEDRNRWAAKHAGRQATRKPKFVVIAVMQDEDEEL